MPETIANMTRGTMIIFKQRRKNSPIQCTWAASPSRMKTEENAAMIATTMATRSLFMVWP